VVFFALMFAIWWTCSDFFVEKCYKIPRLMSCGYEQKLIMGCICHGQTC